MKISCQENQKAFKYKQFFIGFVLPFLLAWVIGIAYWLLATREYKSQWSLLLPGTGIGTSVNLDRIGQAASSSVSAYSSPALDPKQNYAAIALSAPVLDRAKVLMGDQWRDHYKPVIKQKQQTTLMVFSVVALSPAKAKAAGDALLQALEEQLQTLRQQEQQKQSEAATVFLNQAGDDVEYSQNKLTLFQQQTGLLTETQFEDLIKRRAELQYLYDQKKASLDQMAASMAQLQQRLNLSNEQAAQGLQLTTDPLLARLMQAYAEAQTQLDLLDQSLGNKHPRRVDLKQQLDAAISAIAKHAQSAGLPSTANQLRLLSVTLPGVNTVSPQNARLLAEMVEMDYRTIGSKAELLSIQQQLSQTTNEISQFQKHIGQLKALKRDQQIATAIFSSTLARTDISRSDPFQSYPLTQVLMPPTVPTHPSNPRLILLLVGIFASNIFSTGGYLLWRFRHRLPQLVGLNG